MEELWYKNAIIYAVDVAVFQDSDGDGWGDLAGVTQRLQYLQQLGVTCIWLLPFFASPRRDNGYDVADYFRVDPHLGTFDDFLTLLHRAGELGIRIMLDLVMNHTSDEHAWFQAARRDSQSRYRSYYSWTDSPPPVPPSEKPIFPGVTSSVWTFDEVAHAYYFHRFYEFEPGLDLANPEVREEIKRVMDFWLSFDIAGFRIDAASHMIHGKGLPSTVPDVPHGILREIHDFAASRRQHVALLGEADVAPHKLAEYFGDGDELQLLFNFLLDEYLVLGLAQERAEPVMKALKLLPTIPREGQWANFLRNLDELDLERLSEDEREAVYQAFAPQENMRIYGRGLRRRIAPMLGGNQRRLEMAFSLLFSLPGTPVLAYGDEIGMGEDLSLKGRDSVRTPMQWTAGRNAGFSTARKAELCTPVITTGKLGSKRVNVEDQQNDPDSLLCFMQKLLQARRECPEFGWGSWEGVDTGHAAVAAHVCEWRNRAMLAVHNLSARKLTVSLDLEGWEIEQLVPVFGPGGAQVGGDGDWSAQLGPYGYGWFRLAHAGETRPGPRVS